MIQLLGIAGFEMRQLLRRISTWVYLGVLFLIGFVVTLSRAGAWPDFDMGQALLVANSPLRIASLMLTAGVLAVPITAAVAGRAVHRDFEARSFPLFFTAPVPRWAYLGGRYLGAVGANAVILLGVPLGIAAAAASPWGQPQRLTGFDLQAYAHAWFLLALPNLLFTAALFVVLAALTRRMLPNYAGGFVLLVGWALALTSAMAVGEDWLIWLIDPFGVAPTMRSVRYWTVAEQNAHYLPLPTLLLANRAIWLAVGAAALVGGGALFRFEQGGERQPARRPERSAPPGELTVPRAHREFGRRAELMQFGAILRRSLREVVASPWFAVIIGVCLLFVTATATEVGNVLGTRTYPVTYMVLESISGMFALFVILMITVYAGELVWAEREARVAGQADATPLRSWVPIAAKLSTLFLVMVLLMVLCAACGLLIQVSRGYYRFELGQYARTLLLHQLVGFYLPITALAVTVHTLVNQKYLGHFIVIVVFVAMPVLEGLGLEHNLWTIGSAPSLQYSDLNGWGHGEKAWAWYALYWNAVGALLVVVTVLFWQRGEERGAAQRLRTARARLTRTTRTAAAVAGLVAAGSAGWIVYNTTVLNDWITSDEGLKIQADYERLYKRYEWAPQPRVAGVKLAVDIFPERRDVRIRGEYRLRNRTGERVDTVHVDWPNDLSVRSMTFDRPATRVIGDSARGYFAFRLQRPLAPGDSAVLRFDVGIYRRGFTDEPEWGPVLENGTFFNQDLLPRIGYNADGEITDPGERTRRGLPPRPRIASIDDPRHLRINPLSADADWVDFEAVVSTSGDQVAVAPGYLQRSWKRGGRAYFHYRMDAPILKFYAFQSARYAVRRADWRGVRIEVYHHPAHRYNVDRMVRATQRALDYFTREFGPYQHRQVRILEFPRYGDFAQSYPNTIPYSEGIGFIADVRADDIDYPFFVTAHEVAHQWWGHQAVGAAVQGEGMLIETLAEYSALLVMEREYGSGQIGRFLEHDLDQYLRGRGAESRAEMPLALAEQQPYIHYNKGGLAMYALRDYIGEERLNGALRTFLREWRFGGPPYPTSRDLLRHVRAATPDSLRYVVDDLFERITLWDLKAEWGDYQRLPNGRYRVTLGVQARKAWADSIGNERDVAMNDLVDVGVYGEDPDAPIYLAKHRVASGFSEIVVEVPEEPRRAGIDPLHRLIDRVSSDNVVDLDEFEDEPRRSTRP